MATKRRGAASDDEPKVDEKNAPTAPTKASLALCLDSRWLTS